MTMPELPWDGGCRCGKVRIRITAAPMVTAACHCRGCQRMTASAFSTTLILPPDALEVTEGDTVIGGMHGGLASGEHHYCGWCKSWLFTRVPPEYGAINVRATMLDDARRCDVVRAVYGNVHAREAAVGEDRRGREFRGVSG